MPLRATVLKVPHHGSGASSSADFLRAVSPAAAVISCGEGNRYRHPRPETLERLGQVGADVYRTDRDGAIEFRTDGKRLSVRTMGK